MRLQNIYKKYNKFELDIKDISIDKDIIGVLGHIGSGKTTLLKLINGLVFSTFDSTSIDSTYMFEHNTLPDDTLESISQLISQLNETFDLDKCHGLIDRFNMNLVDRIIELSEGQKKIVSFILSISFTSEVLLLDEPFSKIDPYNRKLIINSIIEEKEHHKHIFIASHEIHDLERLVESVILLKNGKLMGNEDTISIEKEYGNIKEWYSHLYLS